MFTMDATYFLQVASANAKGRVTF